MPFTFAHPAIILPFSYCSKKYISLTGLVVGSVTPDFEYFLRMRVMSVYSHTLTGVFWFDLPLAVLLAFAFHNLVRDTLIYHLPDKLAKRLVVYIGFNWNTRFSLHWIVVIISMTGGIGSHLLWDSCTHEHGFFADHLPILKKEIYSLPIYTLLQHSSSVIGIIVIAWSMKQLPAANISLRQVDKSSFWLDIGLLTVMITSLRFLFDKSSLHLGHIIVSAVAASLLSLIIVSMFFKKRKEKNLYE